MLLTEIKSIFHRELQGLYPKEEIDTFFSLVLEYELNLERFVLVLEPQYTLTKKEEQPFFEALSRLKKEEPIQYILGKTHFMDMEFKVNEAVLIPRPETEELVKWIINDVEGNEKKNLRILDIGTGSGCIAIALSKALPEAKITAFDISEKALLVAKENASRNGVAVDFFEVDILNPSIETNLEFDIIVSNPPYVRECEKTKMQNNVIQYEPSLALYVSDTEPLLFYGCIVDFAKKHLKPNGQLYFEINQYLSQETKELLVNNQFEEVELGKDIFGNFRFLKGTKP